MRNDIAGEERPERLTAILVGLDCGHFDDFPHVMEEMENLIDACDMDTAAKMEQILSAPNPATYIGSGKLEELSQLSDNLEADYVIFADNLSPAQLRNIQREISGASVMDRTSLILRIFSERARTREARLQVESASLKYMLPRLVGMRESLGRQGGASGSMSNKGQGEKQIELDRRHIEKRISELGRELGAIQHDREVQRKARKESGIPRVALVGYTNAGKSTLMNVLLKMQDADEEKKVLQKDMLFATLDTTVRRIHRPDRKDFLLSDTVGFISNLPTTLVKAFRSTLEEAVYADLLLIVVDASDEHNRDHIKVTEDTLKELGAQETPRIYVYNKADRLEEARYIRREDEIYISAAQSDGIDELISMISEKVYAGNETVDILLPYSDGDIVSRISSDANILLREYTPEGVHIVADCPAQLAGWLKKNVK